MSDDDLSETAIAATLGLPLGYFESESPHCTPLGAAAQRGHVALVQRLLDSDCAAQDRELGWPLRLAARVSHAVFDSST